MWQLLASAAAALHRLPLSGTASAVRGDAFSSESLRLHIMHCGPKIFTVEKP